jgi:preprotein translocase subunit Sec61beta
MAIILAIMVAVATLLIAALQIFAEMMRPAPSQDNLSLLPTLVIGLGIAGLLLASHWFHFTW